MGNFNGKIFFKEGALRVSRAQSKHMKYIFVGKNIEVSDRLKERFTKKVKKLEKFFGKDTEATATFSITKNQHMLELTIIQNGILFRAEEQCDDMYVSIDRVVDVIERQIRKNKTRLARRIREHAFINEEEHEDESFVVEEHVFDVTRVKRFHVKPMTVDEAILQMNLLGHVFFLFSNSDNKQISVVYKRSDDSYGLIEPEY